MRRKIATMIHGVLIAISLFSLVGCGVETIEDVKECQANGDVDTLIEVMNDKAISPVVQNAAIVALGELKAEKVVPYLEKQLTARDFDRVRVSVDALVSIGSVASQKMLVDLINYKDSRIERVAIKGLGDLKSTVAVPALIKKLDGLNVESSTAVVEALTKIGGDEAVAALVEKLKSPVISLRLSCVKALGEIGTPEAIKGIASVLGDENEKVRDKAIGLLIASGDYKSYALVALRSDNVNMQKSALMIFKATKTHPTDAEDKVWYRIARIATSIAAHSNMKVNDAEVKELAQMGLVGAKVYFQMLDHKSQVMRKYATRALEAMGETVVPIAEKSVNEYAIQSAKTWYSKRSTWAGSPSWKLDLWGAITALNPGFQIRNDKSSGETQIRGTISFTKNKVRREFVPGLILLASDSKERQVAFFGSFSISKNTMKDFKKKAIERIVSSKKESILALIAGMEDENENVADTCVRLLGKIGDRSVIPQIAKILTQKINNADKELTTSGFYEVLQVFDDPSSEAILKKVRPNKERIKRMFTKRYPKYVVVNVRFKNARAKGQMIPVIFMISYYKDDQHTGELRVRFVKNGAFDWVANPPFPKFIKEKR